MKNKLPLVSIITVCYNSSKTIEQTILSVLQQTYSNIEYIIIDGGSTDGTIELIEKYADRISYWVSEPDKGLYDAMNKGVSRATGEIVGIINSDDWYELDAVKRVVNSYNNKYFDVFHGGIRIYDNNIFKSIYNPKTEILKLTMLPHPSCFISKKAYDEIGNYNTDYKISADYELLIRMYVSARKFCYFEGIIANLREGGMSTVQDQKGKDEVSIIKQKYSITYNIPFLKKQKKALKKILMK